MTATSPLVLRHADITFLFFLLLPITLCFNNASGSTTHRPEVIVARHGAVAADDGLCSKIAVDILREGGHAVDAAVTTALCLGVVSIASTGIGGGGFLLLRLANGTTQAFDMRETAPLLASENMYDGNITLKVRGALSVAVPGELAGLYMAWKQHGKLPWKKIVSPAERLARGFKISPYLFTQMERVKSAIFADKGLRDVFTSNGSLLQPGDICQIKKLAETLRTISEDGVEPFYNGSIGINLIKDIQKLGGIMTMKDLQKYQVKMREPTSANILGLKILGMPPPSSGGVGIILLLNILAQYKLPMGISGPLGTHRVIEALKHVFGVRMNIGDPDFDDVSKVVSDMLSPKFAKELKKTIRDDMTFDASYYGGRWNQILDHGTTHFSIVDDQRNAVAMTSTINYHFGAQILSQSTGILLNNQMDDFNMPINGAVDLPKPARANLIRPGKRPLSSASPTIILENGRLKAVLGASGGTMIIPGTSEVILNHFVKRIDPLSSVMAPRVYHTLIPNVVNYENFTSVTGDHFEVPAHIREALHKRGHVLNDIDSGAICQFITLKEASERNGGIEEIVAVSDPRKGGFPAGY